MNVTETTRTFFEFFQDRGHQILPGSSLVPPAGDPVLFTTSGMHPLTPHLEGVPHPRGRRLAGHGLVVVGAGDGVNDLGLVEVLGAFDLGHVADQHAVAHDLGFQAGRAVSVPLGFAAAGQRHADAELAGAAEQMSVNATVAEGVDHPAGAEFVHAWKIAFVPER